MRLRIEIYSKAQITDESFVSETLIVCVVQVSMEPSVFLEVENELTVVAGSKLSQLRCTRDGRDWSTLLPSSVMAAAGSR